MTIIALQLIDDGVILLVDNELELQEVYNFPDLNVHVSMHYDLRKQI